MATKNIKGITIQFGAETKAVDEALKSINKEIKDVDKQLKDVNSALKLDPGNAQEVAKKMELLSEKSELAEKKVEALKAAQKKLDADGVDKNSKAYQELTTELTKAEAEFKQLSVEMQRTQSSYKEVVQGNKELTTYLKATGQSADDLVSILGTKLVDAYKSGSLGAAGYQTALEKVSQQATGSKNNLEALRKVLNSVDDGVDLKTVAKQIEDLGTSATSSKSNVSKLGTEFDTLKSKTNSINSELKAVNDSLKLDPSNVELVTQKQKLLSEAISTSEEKAKLLKQRYNDFKSGNLDLGENEFRELQREISNTESEIRQYKSQLTDLENAQNRLNTYLEASGKDIKEFADILGNELVQKIKRGEASSEELSQAINKIGSRAISTRSDLGKFKSELDSIKAPNNLSQASQEILGLGEAADKADDEIESLADKLDQLNDKVQNSNMMQLADAFSPVTDGIKDLGNSALDSASTVTDSMNKIKIGLGETGEKAEQLADIAREVFKNNFGESLGDVTDRLVYVKQTMGELVDDTDLEPLLSQFITLDDQGMDFNETVRGVKALMIGFGIDAQEALDLMAQGMQNGLNMTDELGDNVAEYSGRWGEAGVTASQYFSLLEAGLKAGGYQLDKVGDFLNEFLTSLQDGRMEDNIGEFTESTQDLFYAWKEGKAPMMDVLNAVIGELRDMDDQTQAATLSGTIWSALGEDNAQTMIQALADVPDSYKNISGAAQEAADNNSNAADQLSRTWENFQLALAPLGEKLAEIANKILDGIIPAIEKMSEWFSNLPEPVQNLVVGLGAFAAIVGTLVPIIGGLVAAFTTISGALATAGIAFTPFLAVIAGVVGAIGGLILIISNWEIITEKAKEWWGAFTDFVSNVWKEMCEGLGEWWDTTWTNITNFFSGIGQGIQDTWSAFCEFFSNLWTNTWNGIKDFLSNIGTGISEGIENIKNWCSEKWNAFCSTLSQVWSNLKEGLSNTWNATKDAIVNTTENIKNNLQNKWETIKTNTSTTWDNIKSSLSSTFDSIKSNTQTAFDNVKQSISNIWNNIKSDSSNIWDNIKSNLLSNWENIRSNASNKFNEIKSTLSNAWENAKSSTSSAWDNIKNAIQQGVENARSNIERFRDAGTTIQNAFSNVQQNLSNIWSNITSTIGNAVNNIGNNIQNGFNQIPNLIRNAIQNIPNIFINIWNSVIESFNSFWKNLSQGISNIGQNIKNAVGSLFGGGSNNNNSKSNYSLDGYQFAVQMPSVPTEWFAKGGILTAPTIFGTNGTSLLGGGEAGREAVLPIDSFYEELDEKIANSNKAVVEELKNVVKGQQDMIKALLSGMNVQLAIDGKELANTTSKYMDTALGRESNRRRRR